MIPPQHLKDSVEYELPTVWILPQALEDFVDAHYPVTGGMRSVSPGLAKCIQFFHIDDPRTEDLSIIDIALSFTYILDFIIEFSFLFGCFFTLIHSPLIWFINRLL